VATFGFVTAYILVCAAAPLYLRALGRLSARAVAVSALAILAMLFALVGNLYPVPEAPFSYLPYLYAVLLLAGFGWSIMWRARNPAHSTEFVPEVAAELGALPSEE
jgi:hypothetical protein